MKGYVRFLFLCLCIFFLCLLWYHYQYQSHGPQVNPRERRLQLQPVSIFSGFTGAVSISGSIAIEEFYPMVTGYILFSGYGSWNSDDHTFFVYSGTVNHKYCYIEFYNVSSGVGLRIVDCRNIRNKNDGMVLGYMQDAINHKGRQGRILPHDQKQFFFFFYPRRMLASMIDIVSSEVGKCTLKSCLLFIDKDLIHSAGSTIPAYISHDVDLEIGVDGALEIHDRNIDDGFVNGYIKNDVFELSYKRGGLFKKLIYVQGGVNASTYSLLLTAGKSLHREAIFHRSGDTISGSLLSSGGSFMLIR